MLSIASKIIIERTLLDKVDELQELVDDAIRTGNPQLTVMYREQEKKINSAVLELRKLEEQWQ